MSKPLFSILHTSARPQKWREIYDAWMSAAVHPEDVEYVLCIDPRWGFLLVPELYKVPLDNLLVMQNTGRRCYVDGVNIAAKASSGRILIVNADDQYPCQDWDVRLTLVGTRTQTTIYAEGERDTAFDWDQINRDFVIEVSTGTPDEHARGIMVMPILSRARYEKLGYVFYPAYESMYADNDFAEHARQDGIVIGARHLMFPHRHPTNGQAEKDEAYRVQDRQEAWTLGDHVLMQRRASGFSSDPLRRSIALCLSGEQFQGPWVDALLQLYGHLIDLNFNVLRVRAATSNVYVTREGIRQAVMSAEPKPDLCLWLDDDNLLSPVQFDALLSALDARVDIDGIAGWCWIHSIDGKGGFHPSCGTWAPDHLHWCPFPPSFANAHELREFEVGGLPVMLMRRSALEKAGPQCFMPIVTAELESGMTGEDISFFIAAEQGGARFLVDPQVRVPHMKYVTVEPVFPSEGKVPVKVACMIRAKNEARWIQRAVQSVKALCGENIFVLDDESTDDTLSLALDAGARVGWPDPFRGQPVDEARDKNWMLEQVKMRCNPDWILCIDGDEELEPDGAEKIRYALSTNPRVDCFALRFLFLWDRPDQIRFDRWYSTNVRQSLFRPIDGAEFKCFYDGADHCNQGLHCSNAPRDLSLGSLQVSLLHYGYMLKEDRIRKWQYYNRIDPNNEIEDHYRHMVQGDVPEVPADAVLKYAGPLQLRKLPRRMVPKFDVMPEAIQERVEVAGLSWSVGGIGKAQALGVSIEAQFAQTKCSDPEEGVRQAARAAIAAALSAQDVGTVIKVSASGSQSTRYDSAGKPDGFTNQLAILVEPQWGFVE